MISRVGQVWSESYKNADLFLVLNSAAVLNLHSGRVYTLPPEDWNVQGWTRWA